MRGKVKREARSWWAYSDVQWEVNGEGSTRCWTHYA